MTAAAVAACVVALKAFSWPHLEHFAGVPAGCEKKALAAAWGWKGEGGVGSGYIGDPPRALSWVSATAVGFPESVRVWLDGEKVVALDTEVLSKPAESKALVAKLGEPAAKLDAYFEVLMPASEWVYPARGLTLYINPDNHVLLRAVGYAPTTLDEYRRHIRMITRPRRR